MSTKYSIQEIIRFAIEIEKEGKTFYTNLSKKSEDIKLKDLFLKLCNEEQNHINQFKNILNALGKDANQYLYHSENEYTAYLSSIIENKIFNEEESNLILSDVKSLTKALDFALEKEYESINFYEKFKKILGKENETIINMVISEENLHVTTLLGIKNDL